MQPFKLEQEAFFERNYKYSKPIGVNGRIMVKESQREKDLKEISSHIEHLKLEWEQLENNQINDLEPIDIIKENIGITAGELENIPPEDIFEIVGLAEEETEEPFTIMKANVKTKYKCDICGKKIKYKKNLSGLIVHDRYFACEKCCNKSSEEDLNSWTESRHAITKDVKPIALWLMQEKNNTQLFEK